MTIHNHYPDLELISPVYCSKNAICRVSPNQQIVTDDIVGASFEIVPKQKDVKGVLLYKIQRKYVTRAGNYHNSNAASINYATASIYLLVVWDIENGWDDFRVCLIECTDDFTWDEDKLWSLRHQYIDQFLKNYNYRTIIWLMSDNSVIKTRYDITYGSDYKLDIVLSEGTGQYAMKEPIKTDPKRLVSLLLVLIVLIYDLSLSIKPSFKSAVLKFLSLKKERSLNFLFTISV
jgi:hypothetical protein